MALVWEQYMCWLLRKSAAELDIAKQFFNLLCASSTASPEAPQRVQLNSRVRCCVSNQTEQKRA
jgi:hypothetical protein